MIKEKHHNIRAIIKSIILMSLGIMLFSCENDINVINSLGIAEGQAVESTYDVEMTITDSGRVTMLMKSPQIDKYMGDREFMEMPKGISIIFYDSVGNVRSTLDADYAISYAGSKIMEAKNNVVAVNEQGQTLYTEELIWDQQKHKIYTENEVKIVTEDKTLFGDGLTADESFNNWEIDKPRGDLIIQGFDEDSTETNE
jgi:LPS export ABC transporter protein LptC